MFHWGRLCGFEFEPGLEVGGRYSTRPVVPWTSDCPCDSVTSDLVRRWVVGSWRGTRVRRGPERGGDRQGPKSSSLQDWFVAECQGDVYLRLYFQLRRHHG